MSNVTKIALSAAIILSAALSALTAANAGTITEQARNAASSGVAAYAGDGSVVEGHWYAPNH
jgi:uncharacterized low-complexity protein